VIGATILMLIALAHQSVRGHRAAAPRVPQSPQPLSTSTVDATGEP
jgi:multicomponent K+:H+ antiporter subunit A